jgi:hypothetical protein
MIYKIDNKYYVKVGKDFTEVELVFKDNDVDLKPTQNKLENNGNIPYEEINFLQEKGRLLEENKNSKKEFDEDNSEKEFKTKNKNFLKSSFK